MLVLSRRAKQVVELTLSPNPISYGALLFSKALGVEPQYHHLQYRAINPVLYMVGASIQLVGAGLRKPEPQVRCAFVLICASLD